MQEPSEKRETNRSSPPDVPVLFVFYRRKHCVQVAYFLAVG